MQQMRTSTLSTEMKTITTMTDMKPSFDGSYRFQYLRPGTYTVFVYSDCVSCPSGIEAISQTVEITGNNEDVILDDLEIRK